MGESSDPPLKLQFDRRVHLEFRGATITSDAGLLACRELDDALGLTETATACLQESRGGRNVQHQLVPLLRQSVYSRVAGYEDTNDAERLAQDPAMRVIVGRRGPERQAASTNTMSRFETEVLTQKHNLEGLARMSAQWVDGAMAHTPHRRVILDMELREPGARRTGGCGLQRPLRLCMLPPALCLQPVRRLRGGQAPSRERAQRPRLERGAGAHRGPL